MTNHSRSLAVALLACLPLAPGAAPGRQPARMPAVRFPFAAEAAQKYQADYAADAGLPAAVTNSLGM